VQESQPSAYEPAEAQRLSSRALSDLLASFALDRSIDKFRDLFDHFAPRLKSFFINSGCSQELSEELVQEVFLIVWKKAHLYDSKKAAASTWLFTIGRNLRIDGLRRRKDIVDMDNSCFESLLTMESNQEGHLDQSRLSELVRASLARLPSSQAEVVRLSFYSGMAHAEIAQ